MGYKVKFDNGYTATFENAPTQADIEEAFAAVQAQAKKPSGKLVSSAGKTIVSDDGSPVWENVLPMATSAAGAAAIGLKPLGHFGAAAGGALGALAGANTNTEKLNEEIAAYQKKIDSGKTIGDKIANVGDAFGGTGNVVTDALRNIYALGPENALGGTQFMLSQLMGAAGALAGAAIPGDTAEEGYRRSVKRTEELTPFLSPQTEPGKAMAGMFGSAVEGYREGVDNLAARYAEKRGENPLLNAGLAGAKALPELLGLLGVGKGIKKAQAFDAVKAREATEVKAKVERDKAAAQKMAEKAANKSDIPVTPSDAALIERLKGIDDILTKTEGAEKGFQRKLRAEETPVVQGRETLYVDPQEQVFRGDPNEPNARLALDRQTEAFDNAADYNQWGESNTAVSKTTETRDGPKTQYTTPSDPLPLLTKESMRSANEGVPLDYREVMNNQLKEEVVKNTIEEHPMLKRAEQAVTKAEELYIKASEQFQEGRVTAKQLARIKRDLDNLRESAERTRYGTTFDFDKNGDLLTTEGVLNELAVDTSRIIDPRKPHHALTQAVEALDSLGLKASERGLVNALNYAQQWGRGDEARKAMSDAGIDGFKVYLDGFGDEVVIFNPDVIAQVSRADTPMEKYTSSLNKAGKNQRGMIQLPASQKGQADVFNKLPWVKGTLGAFEPMQATPAEVIEMAKGKPDIERSIAQQFLVDPWTAGGRYFSEKMGNHPVVRFTMDTMIGKDRAARQKVMDVIHDRYAPAARALSDAELTSVWRVIDEGDRLKQELSLDELRDLGYNEKEIGFIETHRWAMNEALKSINDALAAQGKEPLDPRKGYVAMRSTGDYRRLVYERLPNGKQGDVVGVIGSDFRHLLDKRVKQVEDKYIVGKEVYVGGLPREKGSAQHAMGHALEILSKEDPRVKQFIDTMDEIYKNDAWIFLNSKKHTMAKKGITGMEGRKAWRDELDNAKEGVGSQIAYLENMLKWGELSKGVAEVKEVLKSQDYEAPNAKEWAEDFMRKSLGFNPNEFGRRVEAGIANTLFKNSGIGYSNFRKVSSGARKYTNTSLLSLDPIFLAINMLQPLKGMPGMKAFIKGRGVEGSAFDFGTGYYYLGGATFTALTNMHNPSKLPQWKKELYEYARTNHVWGSDLIEHSNRVREDAIYSADKVANVGMGSVEAVTREITYLAIAEMLYDGGMRKKDGLAETAHNLLDSVMTSYANIDRPNAYDAMGPIGDMSANLMKFKHNEVSRVMMYAKELTDRREWRPLAAELATTVAMAGLSGLWGYEEADTILRFISSKMGNPISLTELTLRLSENFEAAPHMLSNGMFTLLGVDVSKRLGMQSLVANTVGEAVFPGGAKPLNQLAGVWDYLWDPNEITGKKAALEFMPRPAANYYDRKWFSKTNEAGEEFGVSKTYPHKAGPVRTERDINARRFGLPGIDETVAKQKKWDAEWKQEALKEKRTKVLEKIARDMLMGKEVSDMNIAAYVGYEGDLKTLDTELEMLARTQNIPNDRLKLMRAAASKRITSQKQAQRLSEFVK